MHYDTLAVAYPGILACAGTFGEIKRLLCTAPVLCSLDFDAWFILQMDDTERSVLSQKFEDGKHSFLFMS